MTTALKIVTRSGKSVSSPRFDICLGNEQMCIMIGWKVRDIRLQYFLRERSHLHQLQYTIRFCPYVTNVVRTNNQSKQTHSLDQVGTTEG